MPALNEFDLLLVIAQMAVAFAGFASLASALSDRNQRNETRVDAGRLINMLVVSLCTAMLALVPFIPALFGFAEPLVWRSSAVTALATLVSFAPGVMKRTKRMKQYAGFNMKSNAVNLGLTVIAACGFGFCAFGLPALKPPASYVAGLVALLIVCAIVFFRVIASLLRPPRSGIAGATSMRLAIARAISIVGHPVALVTVAALIAASTQGAPPAQLWVIGAALVMLAVVVLGFTRYQVRVGRWAHVDASARGERPVLNVFLLTVLVVGAALLWLLLDDTHMSGALVLAAALLVAALLLAPWVKLSLHVAFAAFATAILWPLKVAVVAGIIVTAAVSWSRLVLGRHVAADIIAGLLLGAVAGGAYAVWVT